MLNVFDPKDVQLIKDRINKLGPESQAQWGKMDVAQMLAHCNVTYEMAFEDIHPKAGAFKRFLLKAFVKNAVVNEKPYPKNSRTAPQFIIADKRVFEAEKDRLLAYIDKTLLLGAAYFDGKESNSFGALSKTEWNNQFAKHLEHHLQQFGV